MDLKLQSWQHESEVCDDVPVGPQPFKVLRNKSPECSDVYVGLQRPPLGSRSRPRQGEGRSPRHVLLQPSHLVVAHRRPQLDLGIR